jgi:hypothetical protein
MAKSWRRSHGGGVMAATGDMATTSVVVLSCGSRVAIAIPAAAVVRVAVRVARHEAVPVALVALVAITLAHIAAALP